MSKTKRGLAGKVTIVLIGCIIAFGLGVTSAYAETKVIAAVEGDIPHLDNQIYEATLTKWVSDPINGFLVNYNKDLEIVPEVAEKWEFADPVTFKFWLRKGVKFHNGREVIAEDVKKSIERIKDPKTGSIFRLEFEVVTSVEAIDRYTGIIHLEKPFASLLDKLSGLAIIPMEVVEEQGDMKTHPVGCGPFKFKEWKKGFYLELEKFEDYWEEGVPKVDTLIFKPILEYSAARAALMSGDIDILLWAKNVDIPVFNVTPDIETVPNQILGAYYVGFNIENAPYDNVKVRQAIKYAIDKKACLDSVAMGLGVTPYVFILKGTPYYTEDFAYETNIEKAKSLMEEAGYPDGFKDTLVTPLTPVEGPLGILVQAQLKKIGIDLKVEKLEVATYIDRVFNRKDFTIMICGSTAGSDPDILLRRYFHSESPRNILNYKNPEIDRLLDEAATTYDFEKRKELYHRIGKILIEDSSMVMLVQPLRHSAVRDYVKGFISRPDLRYIFRYTSVEK